MSNVPLLKHDKHPKKLHLCSYNPRLSLVGKTVYIKRCNAKTHFTEDGKCICCLVGKSVKIVSEKIYYNGYTSFEVIKDGRSFFLEIGEFLQMKQLSLLKTSSVAVVR